MAGAILTQFVGSCPFLVMSEKIQYIKYHTEKGDTLCGAVSASHASMRSASPAALRVLPRARCRDAPR